MLKIFSDLVGVLPLKMINAITHGFWALNFWRPPWLWQISWRPSAQVSTDPPVFTGFDAGLGDVGR